MLSLFAFWPQVMALAVGWAVAGPAAGLMAFAVAYMLTVLGIVVFALMVSRRHDPKDGMNDLN